jgi:hypothetical protein
MRERDSLTPACGSLLEMRDPREELRVCEVEVSARPPGAMPDFATVGADGLVVPIEVPICLPESVLSLVALGLTLSFFTGRASRLTSDSEGVRAVMELPIRDVILRLMRPLEPAVEPVLEFDLSDESETGGVPAVTESLVSSLDPRVMPLLKPTPGALAELEADGVLVVMELPIREVRPELTLLLESRFDSGLTRDGAVALLPGLETDGVREPIELPIRAVTDESMRPLELRFGAELTVEEAPGLVRMAGAVAGLRA